MLPPLVFEKASVFCYRIFDIANEIDLEAARALITEDARRLKFSREGSEYLHLPNPPLAVELGRRTLTLRGGACSVTRLPGCSTMEPRRSSSKFPFHRE